MNVVKSPCSDSLEQLTNSIEDVESGNFRFVGATVQAGYNLIEFAYGQRPAGLYILPAGEIPPSDATIIWRGQLCSSGETSVHHVYRKVPQPLGIATMGALASVRAPLIAASTISRETVVARAMSGVGSQTAYALKNKVNPPLSAEAWPEDGMRTDCSSFVAWCLRMSSKVNHPLYIKQNGGWFETSAVFKDGLHQTGYFSSVATARAGSLLVYPDKQGSQGHIGIVVSAEGPGVAGVSKVVHCSSGSFKKTGKAIAVTGPQAWIDREETIIVDYEGFI